MTGAFDYRPTILSQYANSPTILGLIAGMSGGIDPAADVDAFYEVVWNIDTAVGFGLDIWGRIVNVGRVYPIPTGSYFGFEGTESDGFNQAPFYTGQVVTQNYALSDDAYRQLILAKAMANISDGSIPSINTIMMTLFGSRGQSYVIDNADMTMTYMFDFTPTPMEVTLIQSSGVLPHPGGVALNYRFRAPLETEDGSRITTEDGSSILTE